MKSRKKTIAKSRDSSKIKQEIIEDMEKEIDKLTQANEFLQKKITEE